MDRTARPRLIEESGRARRQAAVFGSLWATAHLIHAWHQGGEGDGSSGDILLAPVLLASLFLLWRPSSPVRLAILAGVQLVVFAVQFPLVANHWTIAAFANLGILITLAAIGGAATSDSGRVLRRSASYLRIVFLVAYSAAALAKVNRAFLDPATSCAVDTAQIMALGFDLSAMPWLPAAIVAVTVITELCVPVLLIVRQTRLLGVCLAAVFHLALAVSPSVVVMDFSMYVFAFLVLFVPDDIGDRLAQQVQASPIGSGLRRFGAAHAPLLRAASMCVVLVLGVGRGPVVGAETWATLSWGTFLIAGVVVVTVALATLATYRTSPGNPHLIGGGAFGSLPHALLIIVLCLNAASPYLGGKTTSSFTMFSNLRTEGGVSNHLFLPRVLDGSPQDDLVAVHASSNESLQRLADSRMLIAYHELRRTLRADPSASVTFTRSGERVELASAGEDRELTSLPYIERKLLHFRPVNPVGPPACQA